MTEFLLTVIQNKFAFGFLFLFHKLLSIRQFSFITYNLIMIITPTDHSEFIISCLFSWRHAGDNLVYDM